MCCYLVDDIYFTIHFTISSANAIKEMAKEIGNIISLCFTCFNLCGQ